MRFFCIAFARASVLALFCLAGPAFAQECSDLPLSGDLLGVQAMGGQPGDTVWVPIYLKTDSAVISFFSLVSYDEAVLAPAPYAGDPGSVKVRPLGRLAGVGETVSVVHSQNPADSGALKVMFSGVAPLPPGYGPIFEIAFALDPGTLPGDSAVIGFPRYTEYVIDSTVVPPDTLVAACRGSELALDFNGFPATAWPSTRSAPLLVVADSIEGPPVVRNFDIWPRSIWAGEEVSFSWDVVFADSIRLFPDMTWHFASTDTVSFFPDTSTVKGVEPYRSDFWYPGGFARVLVVPPGENRYPYPDYVGLMEPPIGQELDLRFYAHDPDGTIPSLELVVEPPGLPPDAVFEDFGTGEARLLWTPTRDDVGDYFIDIVAVDALDPTLRDSVNGLIKVVDTNSAPVIYAVSNMSGYEGDTLRIVIKAFDADGTPPVLEAGWQDTDTLPTNMTFVDSGNGVSVTTFTPDYSQGALPYISYSLTLTAYDGLEPTLTTQARYSFQIVNRNSGAEAPQVSVSPEGPFTLIETDSLEFEIMASTTTPDIPPITAIDLPYGAEMIDYPESVGDTHKIFRWHTDELSAGDYDVSFVAANADLAETLTVSITVTEASQPPIVFVNPLQPNTVTEGNSLQWTVLAWDEDSPDPLITACLAGADTLAPNMTFVDSGNGNGVLTFTPNRIQGDSDPTFYYVRFSATDVLPPHLSSGSAARTIRVFDSGLPCCLGGTGDVDYSGNGEGSPNVADLTMLVAHLFGPFGDLPCQGEADLDGSGQLDVADVYRLVAYLFQNGPAAVPCSEGG